MAKHRKKDKKSIVRLVRKSNDLVEAKYKFDIWEMRVFTKMLTMIHSNDEDFKDYRIYLRDVVEEYELKNNKESYEWLKRGARKLMTKIIRVVRETEDGLTEFHTPIAVGVENPLDASADGDLAYIDVSFHPKMKPFLLALQSKFTTYDVRNILKLPSTYSIRIYELLKQYEKIGWRKISINELKAFIGAIEEIEEKGRKQYLDSYPLYGNFRQRVLLKAQKDLKKYTDIRFEFDPIKKGRKVTEVYFRIFPNRSDLKSQIPELSEAEPTTPQDDDYLKIAKWVGEKTYRKWQQDYPQGQIQTAIRYTLKRLKKGEKIENVGGYIFALIKQTNLFDPVDNQKEQQAAQSQKKVDNQQLKAQLEARQKELYKELQEKEKAVIAELLAEKINLRVQIVEELKYSRFSYYNDSRTLEENFTHPLFYAAFCNKLKEKFPAKFKILEEEYLPQIGKIKAAILRL